MQKITSSFLSLNSQDFVKGLLVAVGGAVIAVIENTVQAGSLTFDWKAIGSTALAAGVSYLGKQFFTTAKIVTPAS